MAYTLLLVGCGNMTGAMLTGWLEAGLVKQALVVKPTPMKADLPGVSWIPPEQPIPTDFMPDMIVLGVKPQNLAEVLPVYRSYAGKAPFLSLAAGKTLAYFEAQLGADASVIRSMPNLPATIGKAVTGCTANSNATAQQREITSRLLQAIGWVHWIEEAQMNALTALSGSGPAYVYLLAELLAKAGEAVGLEPGLATALARETIIGTAELLERSTEDAAILRVGVTSKAGVTEAAIRVLLKDDTLASLFCAAFEANVRRSEELSALA